MQVFWWNQLEILRDLRVAAAVSEPVGDGVTQHVNIR